MANQKSGSYQSPKKQNNPVDIATKGSLFKVIYKRFGVLGLILAFVAIAAYTAATTEIPDNVNGSNQTSATSSVKKTKNKHYSPIGAWINDFLLGKTNKTAPWEILTYHSESAGEDESNSFEFGWEQNSNDSENTATYSSGNFDLGDFEYTGEPYTVIDDNKPSFSSDSYTTTTFEEYSELDSLGRCGPAYACLGVETMPTKERGAISSVTPSGWNNKKYSESVVQGSYIYNRAHLIAHCLGAEDANEKNLITGTRYFNLNMLPFETQVANYIRETNHHVLYRVTPEYEGNNLVASGVQLEARSMEDDEISINVYIYNVQPGITINYSTGENWLDK